MARIGRTEKLFNKYFWCLTSWTGCCYLICLPINTVGTRNFGAISEKVEIFFCQVWAKYCSESGCWYLTLQDCGVETVIDTLSDIAPCIETGIYSVWNNLDNNFTKSRSQGRVFLTDSSLSTSSLQYWIQPNELILLCKFNSSRSSFLQHCLSCETIHQ